MSFSRWQKLMAARMVTAVRPAACTPARRRADSFMWRQLSTDSLPRPISRNGRARPAAMAWQARAGSSNVASWEPGGLNERPDQGADHRAADRDGGAARDRHAVSD